MKKIDINKIASRIVKASDDEQQYFDKRSDLTEKVSDYVCDYVVKNFGTVEEDGYQITFTNWKFVIQCGDNEIDQDEVRKLIRTGDANKRFDDVLKEAYMKALEDSSINEELIDLADMAREIYEMDEDDYNEVDEMNSILQDCDFLPEQEVAIYKNGIYDCSIPWTHNMWGGGAWG